MKEKKEKKVYGTAKVVFLSFLCVLLTFVLGTALLGSLTGRRLLWNEDIAGAAESIPLEQVELAGGQSLAAAINENYIRIPEITDVKVEQILRDGKFNQWVGEKADGYADFIKNYKHGSADNFPMITTAELSRVITENDETIQLHTGIHNFGATNPQVAEAAAADLDSFNDTMKNTIGVGGTATLIRLIVSNWMWCVLAFFLLLVMIWLIVIHVRGKRHVGTAFKTFAITGFIPSLLVFLAGAFGSRILDYAGFGAYAKAFEMLHGAPFTIGGIGALGCVALFGFGVLWNAIAHKDPAEYGESVPAYDPADIPAQPQRTMPEPEPAPAPAPVPVVETELVEEPAPAEEPVIVRHYCRFCGGELINQDAKFCYKCGKPQE